MTTLLLASRHSMCLILIGRLCLAGVDVRVEATSSPVCGFCVDFWWFAGIFCAELYGEFEEAIFVWCFWRAYYEGLDMPDI